MYILFVLERQDNTYKVEKVIIYKKEEIYYLQLS